MHSKWLPYYFLAPSVIATVLLVFYPLVNGIYLSFTDANQYNVTKRIGETVTPSTYEYIGTDNYQEIFENEIYYFFPAFRQTMIWTFVNVFFHVLIGLGLALLLNRNIRGRGIYRMLLIVPWAVPTYISGFSWRFLYNEQYGFFNNLATQMGVDRVTWLSDPGWTMFAVIVANTWLAIPFMMVTFLGGLQSIPPDLYEAAEVDGSNAVQSFRHITLPLLRPVMLVASLLGVIWTFNQFNIIFLVSEGGPFRRTEILATWAWRLGFQQQQYGIAAAYSVIILALLIVFSVFYIRIMTRQGDGL